MKYNIRPLKATDGRKVLDVFNYFVTNSNAAYTEHIEGPDYFERLKRISKEYPFYVVETSSKEVVGYALLHPYYDISAFRKAARITYFILPEHTRQGLGARLLKLLIDDARRIGIESLLASISSLNKESIEFHRKNGFLKCGQFKAVGRKWDKDFDEIWMQKFI
ncbi:MAG: N-acetyltransferase [candidate division Zixibacteria bacterium]|nr:N-acetyltransferase [candidate division Zixibacteria bacterium]